MEKTYSLVCDGCSAKFCIDENKCKLAESEVAAHAELMGWYITKVRWNDDYVSFQALCPLCCRYGDDEGYEKSTADRATDLKKIAASLDARPLDYDYSPRKKSR